MYTSVQQGVNMRCEKCGDGLENGEERELHGQVLCEDCYMDALSPARTCDPWAVHSAKSFMKHEGKAPVLSPTQAEILAILRESEEMEPEILAERLQIKPADLEREIATLRHMEKVRGALKEGKKVVRLW
jgi:protein-arginine kinase activator protein McsA